jgi:hypothetical protein
MTKCKIIMRIQQGVIYIAMLASTAAATNGLGICAQDQLVVGSLDGKVVSRLTNGEVPIARASVLLLRDLYPRRVVAATTSDADGIFKFNKKIKPGKYILKVSYPQLATFYGPVKLMKSGSLAQEIVVTIGADFTKPCGGSSAELRVKSKD